MAAERRICIDTSEGVCSMVHCVNQISRACKWIGTVTTHGWIYGVYVDFKQNNNQKLKSVCTYIHIPDIW